jgi:Lrp/AsnC family leucine-responsive transcriptional regulator|uniref:Leucine-responsive regulatory protein n=1 Tax=mine drainage metagenome TaxID=410659 RepID=E6PKK0_9ZZZZ
MRRKIQEIPKLNAIDRQMLTVLQDDARITALDLSKLVGISPTTVPERIRRMVRDGYILGFEARLNPAKLGAGFLVLVQVCLDPTQPGGYEHFRVAVRQHPEVMECHLVAGEFDVFLKIRTADVASYRAFLARVAPTLPGLRSIRSHVVLEPDRESPRVSIAAV